MKINFNLEKYGKNTEEIYLDIERVIVVGYSGSNVEKINEHIKELEEELGVPAPKRIPTIFECSLEVLTFNNNISFVGNMTSGEAEFLIIKDNNKIYIGLGSDHTDRKLESISVLKAKQICPKPFAKTLWLYDDIKDNWNNIKLESYQVVDGQEILYQKGTLSEILPVEKIISELENRIGSLEKCIVFSGTVPLVSGFKYGNNFKGKLIDGSKNRSINLEYNINVIEEVEK